MQLIQFKLLSFDCYGTLIDKEAGLFTALSPLLERAERGLSRDALLGTYAAHEADQERATPNVPYAQLLALVYQRMVSADGLSPVGCCIREI